MGLIGTALGFPSSFGDFFSGGGITTHFMKQYGKDQAAYQDAINENNLKWTRKARQTEWQDTVNSMRNAGVNPALAYSSGPVSSDMSPTQATAENPLTQMLNIGMQAGALGKQRAETKAINETTELTRQQQETEGTKRALMNAQRINTEADTVIKDKNAHYLDKQMAYQFKKMASETALNYVNASKLRSDITLNQTIQDLKQAETKYTKGRTALLGKDQAESTSSSHSWNIPVFGKFSKSKSSSYNRY